MQKLNDRCHVGREKGEEYSRLMKGTKRGFSDSDMRGKSLAN